MQDTDTVAEILTFKNESKKKTYMLDTVEKLKNFFFCWLKSNSQCKIRKLIPETTYLVGPS